MKILVTGAGGFIGLRIVRQLAELQKIHVDGKVYRITEIYASDVSKDGINKLAAEFDDVTAVAGDLNDASVAAEIRTVAPDVIIHLAAVVSSAAEAEFDLGMKVNVDALRSLIDCCRNIPTPPVFLLSSSLAVFSCKRNATIDESQLPVPLSSYGAQKVIGEILVQDASRKRFIRGRSVRFPTISVRPGRPNSAASSFASGIIREPLAGEEAVLPVSRDTRLFLTSPQCAVDAVFHAIGLRQEALDGQTTITLPGLSVTVSEMIQCLEGIAGPEAVGLIREVPNSAIDAIVGTWPGDIRTPRAFALGFKSDRSFEDLVQAHVCTNN